MAVFSERVPSSLVHRSQRFWEKMFHVFNSALRVVFVMMLAAPTALVTYQTNLKQEQNHMGTCRQVTIPGGGIQCLPQLHHCGVITEKR